MFSDWGCAVKIHNWLFYWCLKVTYSIFLFFFFIVVPPLRYRNKLLKVLDLRLVDCSVHQLNNPVGKINAAQWIHLKTIRSHDTENHIIFLRVNPVILQRKLSQYQKLVTSFTSDYAPTAGSQFVFQCQHSVPIQGVVCPVMTSECHVLRNKLIHSRFFSLILPPSDAECKCSFSLELSFIFALVEEHMPDAAGCSHFRCSVVGHFLM